MEVVVDGIKYVPAKEGCLHNRRVQWFPPDLQLYLQGILTTQYHRGIVVYMCLDCNKVWAKDYQE